jgi:signal transduction histidine kinase
MANLLHGLLSQDTLKPAPRLLTIVFALVPLWILMGGFLWLRPSANMLLGLALAVAAIAVSAVAFIGFDLWIAPAAAIVSLALASPIWSWRRLAAASAFLQSELDRFAREGQGPAATPYAAGDVVSRQTETLRRAMRQLRDFERFTADVLRSLPDAMLVLDENGRVLRFNDKAAALFGGLELGDDIEARFQSLGELTWRRFVSDDAKSNEIVTPAGQVLKVDCVRITDGDDKFAGYIMGLADVTAIRSTERQRERALQLLTHDMRAPQASILTMLQDPRALDDSDAVRRIAAAARRTLDLADAYVQLARAESQPIQPELVDLSQMLLDAADMLWPQASSKDLAITTPTGEEEFLVHGDRTLITRALINLLDNAIKHSPRHSVIVCTLESRLEHQPVCICTIQDQGPGLSPEARERLFQPFGHGGSNVEGSGLGLAFVRTVMERHNGRVQYKPGGAGGAILVLTFPQAIRPIG